MSIGHEKTIYDACDRVLEILDEGKARDEFGAAWTRQIDIFNAITDLSPLDFVSFTLLNAILGLSEGDISAETYTRCVDVLQNMLPKEWQEAQRFIRLPTGD